MQIISEMSKPNMGNCVHICINSKTIICNCMSSCSNIITCI